MLSITTVSPRGGETRNNFFLYPFENCHCSSGHDNLPYPDKEALFRPNMQHNESTGCIFFSQDIIYVLIKYVENIRLLSDITSLPSLQLLFTACRYRNLQFITSGLSTNILIWSYTHWPHPDRNVDRLGIHQQCMHKAR